LISNICSFVSYDVSPFELSDHLAVSSTALMQGRVPDTALTRSVLNSHNLKRSGDIYVVFEPHWFIHDFDGLLVASTHGSPWNYDTYVPVIIMGSGLEPKHIYPKIQTVDVATTLSAVVGTKPPSGAGGQVLLEVVSDSPQDTQSTTGHQ